MKTYHIPNTDLEVSRIAFGTDRLGGSWDKTPLSDELKKKAETLLLAAFEHGINHIDLADIYALGKSDEVVGDTTARRIGLIAGALDGTCKHFQAAHGGADNCGRPCRRRPLKPIWRSGLHFPPLVSPLRRGVRAR